MRVTRPGLVAGLRAGTVAALIAAVTVTAASPAAARLVADVATPAGDVRIGPASPDSAVAVSAADGDGFAPVRFGPARAGAGASGVAPTFVVGPERGSWDWRGASGLRMHLQNAMPWAVTVRFRIHDAVGGSLDATVGLPPGGPLTLTVPLAATLPKRWGLLAGPPIPWSLDGGPVAVALTVSGRIDAGAVTGIDIAVPTAEAAQTLRIGKIFLAADGEDHERAAYTGIVDDWGQYRGGSWPEKFPPAPPSRTDGVAKAGVGDDDDASFAAFSRRREEATSDRVAASIARVDGAGTVRFDAYGGLLVGATANSDGYFRTARMATRDGGSRWVLVTPAGNPFFSIGVNAVQFANSQTFVEGREFMFSPAPPETAPFARFAGRMDSRRTLAADAGAQRDRGFAHGRTHDFYRANLFRRDGTDGMQPWLQRTRDRLRQWQFNTIASWSDTEVADGARMPYLRTIHVDGPFARLSDGHDWWSGIPDPFDPRFDAALDRAIATEAAPRRTDRHLIGYFVDNELGWGNGGAPVPAQRLALALTTLAMDARHPDAHAKRAFVELLRQRHGNDIGHLSRQWDRPFADWAAVAAPFAPTRLPDPRIGGVAADLEAFLSLHANRYFERVAKTLKRHAPNHLYLGSRFASRTPQAVAACAAWCDVVSFNLYLPSIDVGFEAAAFRALGKPAMLTEFHFGSSDRGPFWNGVMAVASEADRGPAYRRMLDSVAANSDFVGTHWFQYLDQPVTGRWLDGENGHLGLVSITDIPWEQFAADVAATNRLTQLRLLEELRPR